MLVNNPMGTRRRRRFYHRHGAGQPIPTIDFPKEEFIDPNFFNYEMVPFDYVEEEEFQPTSRITAGGKRRVNFITVASLHNRLLEIIDSMIALAEAEEREQEKEEAKESIDKTGDNVTNESAKYTDPTNVPNADQKTDPEEAKDLAQEDQEPAE